MGIERNRNRAMSLRKHQRGFGVLSCFLLSSALATSVAPHQICDQNLAPRKGPLGYRLRDNRCEGLYEQEVNASLLFASLTSHFEEYSLQKRDALTVTWRRPGNTTLKIRAVGLKSKTYYRMDTTIEPDSNSFNWPTDVLRSLQLLKSDVGIVGITHLNISGDQRDVYVPLQITQGQNADKPKRYRVIIVPGVELKEVYISLARVKENGEYEFLHKDTPLEYGYYPADRGIGIDIKGADLSEDGLYYLDVAATVRSGGSVTTNLCFYHSRG